MKRNLSHLGIFLFCCISFATVCAENLKRNYGLIHKSNDRYYFHTNQAEIKSDVWLKAISLDISVTLAKPLKRKIRSERQNFIFHDLYAYQIDEQDAQKLIKLGIYSIPVILLSEEQRLNFDYSSLVYSFCSSTEGHHYSVWKKTKKSFERVWSTYAYVGYDVEPICHDWELAK